MTETLGPTTVFGVADYTSRVNTLSPHDFAYWVGTYVVKGTPRDYVSVGPETESATLLSWAASMVGIDFPPDQNDALAVLAPTETTVAAALRKRGAVVVNTNGDIGVCMGMNDVVTLIYGRYFLIRTTEFSLYQASWDFGAYIPGLKY